MEFSIQGHLARTIEFEGYITGQLDLPYDETSGYIGLSDGTLIRVWKNESDAWKFDVFRHGSFLAFHQKGLTETLDDAVFVKNVTPDCWAIVGSVGWIRGKLEGV